MDINTRTEDECWIFHLFTLSLN